jgi:hypothetical protein
VAWRNTEHTSKENSKAEETGGNMVDAEGVMLANNLARKHYDNAKMNSDIIAALS